MASLHFTSITSPDGYFVDDEDRFDWESPTPRSTGSSMTSSGPSARTCTAGRFGHGVVYLHYRVA